MPEYYSFSDEAVNGAISTARNHHAEVGAEMASLRHSDMLPDSGEMSLLAECITVKIEDHKVCLNLPLGVGSVCIPLPINIPNGEVAKACLHICTTFGFPTGVKVTVRVGGIVVVTKTFGKC